MLFALFTIMPFAVCLFWLTVLLLDWRRDNAAQHVLAAFMGAGTVLYLCHAVYFNHESGLSAVSECIYAFCNIGVFPLYNLYICRLTDVHGLSRRHLTMFIPTLAIGVWTIAVYAICPDDAAAQHVRVLVMRIVFMVQLVPISVVCYRRLRRFDREIANYYADTEGRSMQSTSLMMTLLIAGALISGAANFVGRDYFDSSDMLISVPSVLFSALLFGVGYVGTRQEFCIDNLIRDKDGFSDNAVETADDEHSHLLTRLDTLMTESSLYLQPDLRLSEVAAMLGVGRTTLSQRINQELHMSFSDYINRLRVEHACALLSDPETEKMSLTGVAEMSGFSSDSSFYRAFRRHTGKTPKQYTESL